LLSVIELRFLSLTVEALQGKMCQNSRPSGGGRSLGAKMLGGRGRRPCQFIDTIERQLIALKLCRWQFKLYWNLIHSCWAVVDKARNLNYLFSYDSQVTTEQVNAKDGCIIVVLCEFCMLIKLWRILKIPIIHDLLWILLNFYLHA